MLRFIEDIKKRYVQRILDREKQWPPVRRDKLINLQRVETDKGCGFSLIFLFNTGFKGRSDDSSTGLEGRPGVCRVCCRQLAFCSLALVCLVAVLAVIVKVYGPPGDVVKVPLQYEPNNLKDYLTRTIFIKPDDIPTLPTMLNFTLKTGETINIINMIAGKNFKQFGSHALNDEQGNAVNIIAVRRHHDPVDIVTEILTDWLAGKGARPPTWRTLVKCLRTSKLHSLSDQIEGQYES